MQNLLLENKTPYPQDALLGIARRQNNSKRAFLIVNKLQAKHIPATPDITLGYFRLLGQLVWQSCRSGERVLVIGFAETATAIGAAVAGEIAGSVYCHTTRESMPGMEPIVRFLEEHSHAVDQTLYLNADFELAAFDRIVFVDDEITTGKTVSNFIESLEAQGLVKHDVRYTVAALIFSGGAESMLRNGSTEFCYLTRLDTTNIILPDIGDCHAEPSCHAELVSASMHSVPSNVTKMHIPSPPNPRHGVIAADYQLECEHFAAYAAGRLDIHGGSILVLGTEEYMYPSLILGAAIARQADSVHCHATTRSPIVAANIEAYPIVSQSEISSLYDAQRINYLYNLAQYDRVIIATDAPSDLDTEHRLIGALALYGNREICIING